MDICDQADQANEMILKAQLQHRHRDIPEAIATGECLFCAEPLPPNVRWCGAECRDDWEKEQNRD
jgi:hypothetical protein